MLAGPLLTTAEMPLWAHNGAPPAPIWETERYTELPPYVPFWATPVANLPTPYARRVEHNGRHFPKPRKGSLAKWARSVAREAGEFLWGAFQPVKEAF